MHTPPPIGTYANRRRLIFADWLRGGSRLAFALLVLALLLYFTGLATPQIPLDELPRHWGRPAAELLTHNDLTPGWSWLGQLPAAEALLLAATGLLATVIVLALARLLPIFLVEKNYHLALIAGLQLLVLLAAASGCLQAGGP
ncbi:MAG: hypothetical protein K9N49_02825 [Candidatus Marinimicrobia bacterium]|nr:hypothetical protein [Candidatus Neomarinimicrobiota bacterium]